MSRSELVLAEDVPMADFLSSHSESSLDADSVDDEALPNTFNDNYILFNAG